MKTKTKLKRKITGKLKLKLKNKPKRKSHCNYRIRVWIKNTVQPTKRQVHMDGKNANRDINYPKTMQLSCWALNGNYYKAQMYTTEPTLWTNQT